MGGHYEATIEDPKALMRPFKIAMPLTREGEPGHELWEEACFEGERDADAMVRAGKLLKAAGKTGIHNHDLPN